MTTIPDTTHSRSKGTSAQPTRTHTVSWKVGRLALSEARPDLGVASRGSIELTLELVLSETKPGSATPALRLIDETGQTDTVAPLDIDLPRVTISEDPAQGLTHIGAEGVQISLDTASGRVLYAQLAAIMAHLRLSGGRYQVARD